MQIKFFIKKIEEFLSTHACLEANINLLRMLLVTKNVSRSPPSICILLNRGYIDLSRPFDKKVLHLHFYLFINETYDRTYAPLFSFATSISL